jgi:HAD superfamily hydrolase (TIGR01509 family)
MDKLQIKAVIFDMDGLMYDSERLAREAWRDIGARHGLDFTDDLIGQTIGLKCSEVRSLLQRHFDAAGAEVNARDLHRERNELLIDRIEAEGAPVKPGLYDLMDHIRALGLQAAVASASSPRRVDALLRKSGLADAFDAVVTGADAENGKPAPDLFFEAAARLGREPQECLVLEDSANGALAAHAAAMPLILIPDEVEPAEEIRALALAVLPSLADVIPLL